MMMMGISNLHCYERDRQLLSSKKGSVLMYNSIDIGVCI